MVKKELTWMAFMSPQEHEMAGSTPRVIPAEGSPDWYKPVGLLTGEFTIEEIARARRKQGYLNLPMIGVALGVKRTEGQIIGFAFCDLDTEGRTHTDPDLVLGKWNPEIRKIQGENLTERLIDLSERLGSSGLRLRREGRRPEGGRSSKERK